MCLVAMDQAKGRSGKNASCPVAVYAQYFVPLLPFEVSSDIALLYLYCNRLATLPALHRAWDFMMIFDRLCAPSMNNRTCF